ncbi:MAG: signal peptidase II [Deltaproteobacteria bacterium]|nr:MAG: signal peptidase II [Deltaproteobacteria bacterium]
MKRKYRIFLIVFVFLLALDQVTKLFIEHYFPFHQSKEVIKGVLNITHVLNKGAAFGLMADRQGASFIFVIISLVAIVFILYYFRRIEEGELWTSFCLSLIFTGAVGNLIDRFRVGGVVDFLDFHYKTWHWPAFNVADAAITVGVSLLAIKILWGGRKVAKEGG